MDAVQSMNGIRNCIRAALAESAVCSQFKPGESGQVWEPVQVPVMGEAVAYQLRHYFRGDGDDGWGLWHQCTRAQAEIAADTSDMEVRELFEKPATSITQAELCRIAQLLKNERYDDANDALLAVISETTEGQMK
jgi:hypothetical protein